MNGIDSDERIFYDDLYLDVVITKNRNVILINEDKINSALNNFVITSEQYKNAYREARDIMDKITKEGMEKIEVKSKKYQINLISNVRKVEKFEQFENCIQ